MAPPQQLRPVGRTGAFLTRSHATPRESVVGGSMILLALSTVAGLVLVRLMKRALLD